MNAGTLNRLELLRRALPGQLQTADAKFARIEQMRADLRADQKPADESSTPIHPYV
jgi:hypothetical protein